MDYQTKPLKRCIILTALVFLSTTPSLFAMTQNSNDFTPRAFLHLDWRDMAVSPSDDFYAYANGSWQKKNPIPPEYSVWSSFSILVEKTQKQVHALIQQIASKKAKPGSIEQKVGDFYYSGMDEPSINSLGIIPLKKELAEIAAIKNQADFFAMLPTLQLIGIDVLFSFGNMPDFKNSKYIIGVAEQGGLGLPDRDYYLKTNEKFKKIREAYLNHIAKFFELLGDPPKQAEEEAAVVLRIETTLAAASMSQVALRDPKAVYHMKDVTQLEALTPFFPWKQYLIDMGLPQVKRINLATPVFFIKLNQLLQTTAIEDWKIYLRWHLINSAASYLSQPFVDENFKMTTVLTGTKKILPRWRRVVSNENWALGFAIGKLYVEKYFSAEDKKKVLNILQMIKKTLRADLQTLSWMSPETRKAAIKKLDLMEERIGYPEKWRDYTKLTIDRGPYVRNIIRASAFAIRRDLDKIDKPLDRNEWEMTPQTVNAYYDPAMNNINLPAAILQSPFFEASSPAAVNFGSIGFVAAHEMTHGFDDSGAQFDGYGNLNNWWSKEDLVKFKQATDCIAEQFSKYRVADNVSIQGKLVVGEAVADLGGLILAYRAFHASDAYKTAKNIEGLTPDQQFFLSAAHAWAGNIRPEQEQNLATTDAHPPMKYRVNGTLANIPQFQAAYTIKNPSVMVAVKRCVIW